VVEEVKYTTTLSSIAEDLFLEIFCDVFGPKKWKETFLQTHLNVLKTCDS